MFKVCGDIVLVRILRPGNPIPADVRPFVNKHPEMAGKVCALVEFERTEFAMKAVREKNCEEEEKMKVGQKLDQNLTNIGSTQISAERKFFKELIESYTSHWLLLLV